MDTKSKNNIFKAIRIVNYLLIIGGIIISIVFRDMDFLALGGMVISLIVLGSKVAYSEFKTLLLMWSLDRTITDMVDNKVSTESIINVFSKELPENFKREKVYVFIGEIGKNVKTFVQNRSKNEQTINKLINNVVKKLDQPINNLEKGISEVRIGGGNLENLHQEGLFTKKLIDDLFESSKASCGALSFRCEDVNINYMIKQAIGEFSTNIETSQLSYELSGLENDIYIKGDPEKIWRVLQILLENTLKHSLAGTRVYIDSIISKDEIAIIIKSISKKPLNIDEKLLYKKIEEDREAWSTGLPLETCKSIINGLNGEFQISIDGDLFKTVINFKREESGYVTS
ncbi:MAG: sensor histidine kinase [Clostridium sp.]